MDSGPAWDETTTVMMMKVYLGMAVAAKGERMFKGALELLVEELERSNYLKGESE